MPVVQPQSDLLRWFYNGTLHPGPPLPSKRHAHCDGMAWSSSPLGLRKDLLGNSLLPKPPHRSSLKQSPDSLSRLQYHPPTIDSP